MRKQKERIELTDTMLDIFMKMSDGNPGATTALIALAKETPAIDPDSALSMLGPILHLDSLGIYGSNIWILWKACDHSALNLNTLLRLVQLGERDKQLVIDASNDIKQDFNFPGLLEQLQETLPKFGRVAAPVEEAPVGNSHA